MRDLRRIFVVFGVLFMLLAGCGGSGSGGDSVDRGERDGSSESGTSEIVISDIYPASGAAGTYVELHLSEAYDDDLSLFRAFYNEEEVAVVAASEDTVQVAIPATAASGTLYLRAGEEKSNTVNFFVQPVSKELLHQEIVSPSSAEIEVRDPDGSVAITIPGGLLNIARKVSLEKVENAPPSSFITSVSPVAYDVSIEGLTQLDTWVEIAITYDPLELNSDYPAADQLIALRWDDDEGVWITLPYRVDEESSTLYVATDHLSLFAKAVIVKDVVSDTAGSKDIYFTPQGNFRFFYNRASMDDDPIFSNENNRWDSARPDVRIAYNIDYPVYIQDIGQVFEVILENYKAFGFPDPTQTPGLVWGTWKHPVNVKIDSIYGFVASLGKNDPTYEKVFQRLHFPKDELKDFDIAKSSYHVIGHELFHRIQGDVYGFIKNIWRMRSGSPNLWWLEATAEFAGSRAALGNEKLTYLHRQNRSDFLSHSLNTTGPPSGGHRGDWNRSYEYAASAFVQFLVEVKGYDFKQLMEDVAKDNNPLATLAPTLRDNFAEYAAWVVFSENTPVRRSPVSIFDWSRPSGEDETPGFIAEKMSTIDLESSNDKIKLEVAGGSNTDLYVFRGPESGISRYPGNTTPRPYAVLKDRDEFWLDPNPAGEILYLLAVNKGTLAQSLSLDISVDQQNIEEFDSESLNHRFDLKQNYTAKLWAIKINLEVESLIEVCANPSTPSSDFLVVGDGSIVRHLSTGLEWQRCPVGTLYDPDLVQNWIEGISFHGGCLGTPTRDTLSGAVAAASSNWRVPEIDELMSIVESQPPPCRSSFESFNPVVFPVTNSSRYWSITPFSENTDSGLISTLVPLYGVTSGFLKTNSAQVRLVRDIR